MYGEVVYSGCRFGVVESSNLVDSGGLRECGGVPKCGSRKLSSLG